MWSKISQLVAVHHDHFPHDAGSDGPKAQAVFHDLGLLEDGVPKWGESSRCWPRSLKHQGWSAERRSAMSLRRRWQQQGK